MQDYGQATPFVAVIDTSGVIYQTDSGRKRQAVGVDLQRESELTGQIEEMQEVIENYFQKLVELGAIVPEKSPEQVAREAAEEQLRIAREQSEQQARINAALLDAVNELRSEIAEMKQAPTVVKSETVEEHPPVAAEKSSKGSVKKYA